MDHGNSTNLVPKTVLFHYIQKMFKLIRVLALLVYYYFYYYYYHYYDYYYYTNNYYYQLLITTTIGLIQDGSNYTVTHGWRTLKLASLLQTCLDYLHILAVKVLGQIIKTNLVD